MKKVLILSFHALPMNVIASYRTHGYLSHLHKYGLEPTLLTHVWDLDNQSNKWKLQVKESSPIEEKGENFKIIRIPRYLGWFHRILMRFEKGKIGVLLKFCLWLSGHLDGDVKGLISYNSFKHFLKSFDLSEYSCVIALVTPFHHVKLASKINNEYKIPVILDFRDPYHPSLITENYRLNNISRIELRIKEYYLKKWARNTDLVTSVGDYWSSILGRKLKTDYGSVLNGFESEFLHSVDFVESSVFEISCVGSLYENQNLSIFFEGLKIFLSSHEDAKISVNFIGIKNRYRKDSWTEIVNNVDKNVLNIKGYVEKEKAIEYLKRSHILIFPIPIGQKGYYTGKIFEYLGVQRNILAFPDNGDVVSQILKKTKAGVSVDKPIQIADYIEKKYQEWQKDGSLEYEGSTELIKTFDRQTQTEIMARYIKSKIKS